MRPTAGALARTLRRHPLAGTLLLVLAGVFAVLSLRALAMVVVWTTTAPDHAAPIEGWMTPRYVVRLRDVPPDTVHQILDLRDGSEKGTGARATLAQLAAERGVPLDRFLVDLEDGIAAARRAP